MDNRHQCHYDDALCCHSVLFCYAISCRYFDDACFLRLIFFDADAALIFDCLPRFFAARAAEDYAIITLPFADAQLFSPLISSTPASEITPAPTLISPPPCFDSCLLPCYAAAAPCALPC